MIAQDKKLHLIAGFLVGAAATFLLANNPEVAVWLGGAGRGGKLFLAVVAACLVGVGKEIYDHFMPGHTVDALDAVYTGGGGVVGAVAATIVMQLA